MSSDISDRSRAVALLLAAVVGVFGGHRFYVGKVGTGLLQLCTFGGLGIWWLYDFILVAAGSFRDADGKRVFRWGEEGAFGTDQLTEERYEMLLEEIDRLREEMTEMDGRVDFMERVLTKTRERGVIPPS